MRQLKRSRQTIHKVYQCFKQGKTVLEYYQQYKQNKPRRGRKSMVLPKEQASYVQKMAAHDWSPDVIIGRAECSIDCSVRTLYRMFEKGVFNVLDLPLKGKRKPNGHREKRGKQTFRCSIHQRKSEHTNYSKEFGHLERDTIVGVKHKSAAITLVECLSKVIITLKPQGRQAIDIENGLNQWFESVPKHLFKSIIFDCAKEFSSWKTISNVNDIASYLVDPGSPSQRRLNENSNGLLRRDGLSKTTDFNDVTEVFIQSVASERNYIPRKSLNYQTPLKVFISYVDKDNLSSLI